MINEELETILNNTAEEILTSRESLSELNTDTLPRKMNEYESCIGCDRRLFVGLFKNGSFTCCHCKNEDAYGNKVTNKKDEWGGL